MCTKKKYKQEIEKGKKRGGRVKTVHLNNSIINVTVKTGTI